MIFKRPKSAVSNQRGFTLVELMMVMGILGMLAAIGLQQITVNRAKALDTQVVALVKNLLTAVAIDEPTGVPPAGPGFGGTLKDLGLPEIEVPAGVTWRVFNPQLDPLVDNEHDIWMFYLAHPRGIKGYYFWIPGNACDATVDDDGNPSDYIWSDTAPPDLTPFRTAAGV